MTAVLKGIESLQNEIDRARQSLRNTDESIKKITGREGLENRSFQVPFPGRAPVTEARGRSSLFALAGYNQRGDIAVGAPPPKRPLIRGRLGGPFASNNARAAADSGDEEELPHKPAIASSVTATNKDAKSRQDIIEQQNKDGEGKARNRRMFGLLMGTLQQFKVEEKMKEDQEMKRKAVEKKLEEKQKEEKEQVKKEKQHLFLAKKEQQGKLRQLEQKMELVQIHEDWEFQTKQLMYFVRTDSKPHIYFLPKLHTEATEKKLEESKKTLQDIIDDRRKELEEEINEIVRNESEDMEIDGATPKKPSVRNVIKKNVSGGGGKASDSELEDDTVVGIDYGDDKVHQPTEHRKEPTEHGRHSGKKKQKKHASRRSADVSDSEMKYKDREKSEKRKRSKRDHGKHGSRSPKTAKVDKIESEAKPQDEKAKETSQNINDEGNKSMELETSENNEVPVLNETETRAVNELITADGAEPVVEESNADVGNTSEIVAQE